MRREEKIECPVSWSTRRWPSTIVEFEFEYFPQSGPSPLSFRSRDGGEVNLARSVSMVADDDGRGRAPLSLRRFRYVFVVSMWNAAVSHRGDPFYRLLARTRTRAYMRHFRCITNLIGPSPHPITPWPWQWKFRRPFERSAYGKRTSSGGGIGKWPNFS